MTTAAEMATKKWIYKQIAKYSIFAFLTSVTFVFSLGCLLFHAQLYWDILYCFNTVTYFLWTIGIVYIILEQYEMHKRAVQLYQN